MLMEVLHDYAKKNNFDKLILHAQLDVVTFYIKLGYAEEGADELVFLDIAATLENRGTLLDMVNRVAHELNIPFTVSPIPHALS